jgi:hypothetical protein
LSSFLGAAVVPFVVVFHAAPILPTLPLAVCSVLQGWNTTLEPSLFVKQECDTRWCGCRRRHLSAGVASSSCRTLCSPVVFVNDLHGRPPWTGSPEVTGFSTLPTLPPFHTTLGKWRRVLIGAVGASLIGTSSWVSRSTWRPTSTDTSYARRVSSPRMNSYVTSATNTHIFKCADKEWALSASPSRQEWFPWTPVEKRTVDSTTFPAVLRRYLAWRLSQMSQCRWSLGTASPVYSSQWSGCLRSP